MANIGKQIADFFAGGSTTDHDEGLRGLFISELQGMYYAEKALVDNMPNMADAATTDEVRQAFQHHLEETRGQVTRLERIFDSIGVSADDKTCNAINGLADDAEAVIGSTESGSLTRDAGLIIAAQKVEHHEIAAYGSLHALAQLLGYTEATQLIEQSLQEEKNTDKKLTQLAESFVNERAKSEGNANRGYENPNRRNSFADDDTNNGRMAGVGSTSGSQSGYASGANYQSGSAMDKTTSYSGNESTDREPMQQAGFSPGREGSSGNATSGGTLGV